MRMCLVGMISTTLEGTNASSTQCEKHGRCEARTDGVLREGLQGVAAVEGRRALIDFGGRARGAHELREGFPKVVVAEA